MGVKVHNPGLGISEVEEEGNDLSLIAFRLHVRANQVWGGFCALGQQMRRKSENAPTVCEPSDPSP